MVFGVCALLAALIFATCSSHTRIPHSKHTFLPREHSLSITVAISLPDIPL